MIYNSPMKAKILLVWMGFYLIGCLVAFRMPTFVYYYLIGAAILFFAAILLYEKRWIFALIFGMGIFLLAVWNFQTRANVLIQKNKFLTETERVVVLTVDDLPQKALHGYKVRLAVNSHTKIIGYFTSVSDLEYGRKISANIKVKLYKTETMWRLMDTGISGETTITEYKVVGANNSIRTRVMSVLLGMRHSLNNSISRLLPEREAGLASGIILGEKALVSPEMIQALKVSGTTHIIALSGYNITIILSAILLFRNKMSRRVALSLPIGLILIFTVMTGAAPSLVRAAIMGSMPILARFLYRESDSFISIIFSATVMAVVNPFLPLFDIGFQLSFLAFAGIIYLTPIVEHYLKIFGEDLAAALSETLGAQIATMPLLSYYFGIISVISPVTNFIILGILPACMAMSFATGLFGMVWEPLGALLAAPTYLMLSFVNNVIDWSGSLSWAATSIKIENPWWLLILYLFIFDIWFFFRKVGSRRPT